MKIVVLDGYTENPGDLSWEGFEALGDMTVYDRTAADEILARAKGAQVLVDTDRFLEMNRQRSLDDGFMHAVFNPSFNALATAMATARHRASKVLEIARDRHVEQALNETPEKLNRDRRLVLLSDPVTMARLHFRVWNSPERYSSWVSYYEGIKLNPLALRKPDAASQ